MSEAQTAVTQVEIEIRPRIPRPFRYVRRCFPALTLLVMAFAAESSGKILAFSDERGERKMVLCGVEQLIAAFPLGFQPASMRTLKSRVAAGEMSLHSSSSFTRYVPESVV